MHLLRAARVESKSASTHEWESKRHRGVAPMLGYLRRAFKKRSRMYWQSRHALQHRSTMSSKYYSRAEKPQISANQGASPPTAPPLLSSSIFHTSRTFHG